MQERPQCPIFTIHDSMLTVQGVEYVREVMLEEFEELGIKLTLKEERQ
jgi:hypothetical protein